MEELTQTLDFLGQHVPWPSAMLGKVKKFGDHAVNIYKVIVKRLRGLFIIQRAPKKMRLGRRLGEF